MSVTHVAQTILYEENNVMAHLKNLTDYDSSIHLGIDHHLWYRTNIDWDIECEWESGINRDYLLDTILAVNNAVSKEIDVKIVSIIHLSFGIVQEFVKYCFLVAYKKTDDKIYD